MDSTEKLTTMIRETIETYDKTHVKLAAGEADKALLKWKEDISRGKLRMEDEKYPEWLSEEERKSFDTARSIAKQFDAECLMMYPNTKTVFMITQGELETDEILPVLDRFVREESLTLDHVEIPNLTAGEKYEGMFYRVETGETL